MKFRTDINGLRTYAVLAVIIFHFKAKWLPGGFAGVDVFFVISGYLMTSIIFRGLENNSLSLLKFYSARIKRIVPALLVLVIVLMIFGFLFLAPNRYEDLAKHSGGSLLFISNFMYWLESGYFDSAAREKFLLHTWSLSVEWQFYIIYPIVLLILSKFLKLENLKKTLVALTAISLIIAIYASPKWPTASYFLLHTRMWEMLLGGVAFLYPFEMKKQSDKHILELSGLALIFVSFFIVNENTVWPGYAALIPTLGAFILIQANNDKSIFTNNIVCQKLGLWSYSLYLWHWPLLAGYHHFDKKVKFWPFLFITLALGIASYYLIEKRKFKTSKILLITLLAILATISAYVTEGYKDRVDPRLQGHDEKFMSILHEYITTHAEKTDADFLMLGDSHAGHYMPYMTQNNIDVQTISAFGCLFLSKPALYVADAHKQPCIDVNNSLSNTLKHNNKPIIWAQYWDLYDIILQQKIEAKTLNTEDLHSQLTYEKILRQAVISVIEQSNDVSIYIIGQVVLDDYDTAKCVSERQLIGSQLLSQSCNNTQSKRQPKANQILHDIADQYPNVHFIDPNEAICNDTECYLIKDGLSLFKDNNHLSISGSNIIGGFVFNQIRKLRTDIESKK